MNRKNCWAPPATTRCAIPAREVVHEVVRPPPPLPWTGRTLALTLTGRKELIGNVLPHSARPPPHMEHVVLAANREPPVLKTLPEAMPILAPAIRANSSRVTKSTARMSVSKAGSYQK